MKVSLLNATDAMGSGIACLRLLEALEQEEEIKTNLIVQKSKKTKRDNVTVLKKNKFDKITYLIRTLRSNQIIKHYTDDTKNFSTGLFGISSMASKLKNNDVIHLHWINDSFISLDGLHQIGELNKPVFWTLRDLWPITGGCHYNGGCQNFTTYCHQCPELNSSKEQDLSYKIWAKKKMVYDKLKPIFITPSEWMAQQVENSSLGALHKVHVLPNPINHELFAPIDSAKSRKFFNLPKKKTYILFGAINATSDQRKGYKELMQALQQVDKEVNLKASNVELLVFGNDDHSLESELNINCHFLGHIESQDALINCYNSADYLVIPSLQDNLPKTVMEALACGIPTIGFNTGGIPEMIDTEENGFLAEWGNSEDLAYQIKRAIKLDQEKFLEMKANARQKVLHNYTYGEIAYQHLKLYKSYLNN